MPSHARLMTQKVATCAVADHKILEFVIWQKASDSFRRFFLYQSTATIEVPPRIFYQLIFSTQVNQKRSTPDSFFIYYTKEGGSK